AGLSSSDRYADSFHGLRERSYRAANDGRLRGGQRCRDGLRTAPSSGVTGARLTTRAWLPEFRRRRIFLAKSLAATFSQACRRMGRRAAAVTAERSTIVLPLLPQAPAAGRNDSGAARTSSFCCSGVSLTIPRRGSG